MNQLFVLKIRSSNVFEGLKIDGIDPFFPGSIFTRSIGIPHPVIGLLKDRFPAKIDILRRIDLRKIGLL